MDKKINYAIQVNGSVVDVVEISVSANADGVDKQAQSQPKTQKKLDGKQVIRRVFVPGRLLNYIVTQG